ncbi:hypothetical protein J008_03800, partial [Cryptococcus neoformans]
MTDALESFAREADTFGTHTIPVGRFELISRPDSKL